MRLIEPTKFWALADMSGPGCWPWKGRLQDNGGRCMAHLAIHDRRGP